MAAGFHPSSWLLTPGEGKSSFHCGLPLLLPPCQAAPGWGSSARPESWIPIPNLSASSEAEEGAWLGGSSPVPSSRWVEPSPHCGLLPHPQAGGPVLGEGHPLLPPPPQPTSALARDQRHRTEPALLVAQPRATRHPGILGDCELT